MFRFLTSLFTDDTATARPTTRTVLGGQGIALDAREVPATMTPQQLAGVQAAIQSLAQPITPTVLLSPARTAPATTTPSPVQSPTAPAPAPIQQAPAPVPDGGPAAPPTIPVGGTPTASPAPTAPQQSTTASQTAVEQAKELYKQQQQLTQQQPTQQQQNNRDSLQEREARRLAEERMQKAQEQQAILKLAQQLLPTLQSVIAKFAVPLTPVTKG